MKKIIIVGGNGSIGQNLSKTLKQKYEIYVIDKNPPRRINQRTTFLQCDLNDLNSLSHLKNQFSGNYFVVYLAGNLSNQLDHKNVSNSFQENVNALINFLNLFHDKISHFLYISSVSVYGYPNYIPIDENHPISPFSLYGSMKACAEIICNLFSTHYNVPYTIIRSAQLYDVDSSANSLPHILVKNLKKKKSMKITCDPTCERDYLHIDDFVLFIDKFLLSPKIGIYNLGSGYGISIMELFKTAYNAISLSFDNSKLIADNTHPSFSQILDISKIKKEFDFLPKFNIKVWISKNLNT